MSPTFGRKLNKDEVKNHEHTLSPLLGFDRHPDHRGGFQPLVGHASFARAVAGGAGRRAVSEG